MLVPPLACLENVFELNAADCFFAADLLDSLYAGNQLFGVFCRNLFPFELEAAGHLSADGFPGQVFTDARVLKRFGQNLLVQSFFSPESRAIFSAAAIF